MNEWKPRNSKKEVSPAKLKWFDKCPYAFKLKYLEKIEPMYYDPDIFRVGAIVHEVIHEYYMIRPEIEVIKDSVLSIFYRKWDYSLHYDKFSDALNYVKHFIDFEIVRRRKENIFPVSEVEISRNGFFGIIDFLMEDKKLIIDFKTGKRARERKSYTFQAVVYNMLAYEDDVVYFYYLGPNEIIDTRVTQEMVDEVVTMKQQIEDAFASRNFPATGNCSGCEYKHCCTKRH